MNSLPVEILERMCLMLDISDLLRFCSTTRTLSEVGRSKRVWRSKLRRDFPRKYEKFTERAPSDVHWRLVYEITYLAKYHSRMGWGGEVLVQTIGESYDYTQIENCFIYQLKRDYHDTMITELQLVSWDELTKKHPKKMVFVPTVAAKGPYWVLDEEKSYFAPNWVNKYMFKLPNGQTLGKLPDFSLTYLEQMFDMH